MGMESLSEVEARTPSRDVLVSGPSSSARYRLHQSSGRRHPRGALYMQAWVASDCDPVA
jgi:hypothetical protein